MSVTRETTIFCDRCGNWERVIGNAKIARRALHNEGWKQRQSSDFCPQCVNEEEEKWGTETTVQQVKSS